MQRLTEKMKDPVSEGYFAKGTNITSGIICRLGAYEDTGLEPEEILTGLELANVFAALQQLKRYEAIGTVEQLSKYKDAEEGGRLVRLPCKVGEHWQDKWGDTFIVIGFHLDESAGWSVLYRAENEYDLLSVNFVYWSNNLTKETAEQALSIEPR